MKKLVATILIALMAMSCLLAFVGCNDNDEYGDNFAGAISQSTYDSVEDAVKGFLAEEISGQAFTAEYVGYTKTADLSEKEINELAIDEELKSDIVSVEKGEVEYIEKENVSDDELLTKLAVETCKQTVYIVVFLKNGEKTHCFYVPAVEVGQSPSASAWDSIFEHEKYYNCTVNVNGYFEDETFTETFMFSKEAIYTNTATESQGFVIKYKNNLFTAWEDFTDNSWSVYEDDEEIKYMDEYLFYIFWLRCGLYQSHGYFVKTDKGYKSRGNFRADVDINKYSILSDYEITIKNGKIFEISFRDEYHYIDLIDLKDEISATGIVKVTFSDYGTTKVDIPKEVMTAIKEYAEKQ